MALENEIEVGTALVGNYSIRVTNKFISRTDTGNPSNSTIIPIDKIDSIDSTSSQNIISLILGVIGIIIGIIATNSSHSGSDNEVYFIVGFVFIGYWWFTRKTGIKVYSVSGKTEIGFKTNSNSKKYTEEFIKSVKTAIIMNEDENNSAA